MSVHDGPGLRSVVFLKGCNMRCRWCHNPETWQRKPQLQYVAPKCIACLGCTGVCPTGALSPGRSGPQIDYGSCTSCGICADYCPAKAISLVGRNLNVADLWMCDLKILDPRKHKEWTGVDNHNVKANILRLADSGHSVIVRTPVIPGVNDSDEEIEDICRFLTSVSGKIRYELLGFHTPGFGKFEDLGMDNLLGGYAASIGWAIMQCTAIIASNTAGIMMGEWNGAPRPAVMKMAGGMSLLVLSVVIISLNA